jgi:hypothetical protein
MAARKKTAGTKRRRWPLVVVALSLAVSAVICLTEPRQLPALVADQPAVRRVYAFRDGVAAWVHRQLYPLSALRDDAKVKSGAGYSATDRDALDDLINQKATAKDTPEDTP